MCVCVCEIGPLLSAGVCLILTWTDLREEESHDLLAVSPPLGAFDLLPSLIELQPVC